jgi:hypothetical protein
MVILKRNDLAPSERGTWQSVSAGARAVWKAIVSCPRCGFSCSLRSHDVDAAGVVTPSLVCPNDGCDFHDHVTLEGWAHG